MGVPERETTKNEEELGRRRGNPDCRARPRVNMTPSLRIDTKDDNDQLRRREPRQVYSICHRDGPGWAIAMPEQDRFQTGHKPERTRGAKGG
jgi:hypothetical protein